MTYRQVELQQDDTRTVCWVEDDPRLRPGVDVTLKDALHTGYWRVVWVSEKVVDQHQRRTWRVGGIYER